MPLLPTSGTISFDDLRSNYSVTGEIPLSDMYRGKKYVASYYRSPVFFNFNSPLYYVTNLGSSSLFYWYWDGTNRGTTVINAASLTTTWNSVAGFPSFSDWTLHKGTLDRSYYVGKVIYYEYSIFSTYSINQSVPTYGISLAGTINNQNAYGTSAGDRFGWRVAIYGNYCAICAYLEDDAGGGDSGKVYVYDITTRSLLYTLNNPNSYSTSAGDQFGWRLALSANYCAVTAPLEDTPIASNSGTVYIFNISNGSLVRTINNPNQSTDDLFGFSVDVDGDYCFIGVAFEDIGGTNAGVAYMYQISTGNLLYTLNSPSPAAFNNFGRSVAIEGNYCIVGSPYEDSPGTDSGKAYIFNVSTGTLLFTLTNPNTFSTANDDYFGYKVAISGTNCAVGAYNEKDAVGNATSGAVYIFNVTTGALRYVFTNPNAYLSNASDYFGIELDIDSNYCVVGAPEEDDAGGTTNGKAYVYSLESGLLINVIDNPNAYTPVTGDQFGTSVAVYGNYFVVGAQFEGDAGGSASGKAYVYNISQPSSAISLSQFYGQGSPRTTELVITVLYSFTNFTFTNAGITGRTGPTLANCLSSYNTTTYPWLSNTAYFNVVTQGYQLWTVPATGTYRIEAIGAAGGGPSLSGRGSGARIRGEFSLTQGQKLKIVVGQMGSDGNNPCGSTKGGGGGGSFVVSEDNSTIYVIAGGGGGGSRHVVTNMNAVASSNGVAGSDGGGAGGTAGSGGGTQTSGCVNGSSGGGGYTGNGTNGTDSGTSGGQSFTNGAVGGTGGAQYGGTAAAGGFGGGGGSSSYMGGGGGGYSGGGGGGVASCSCASVGVGGGGGSINNGSNQANSVNFNNTTHGSVLIEKL